MKAVKAKEIEKKFDEGGDISGHLDLSKARRPDQEQKRVKRGYATSPCKKASVDHLQQL